MERDAATTSYGEERGAGGKLRKPLSRKPPATPYARPPDGGRRRWLSKLVDPACRIIATGASLILPSSLFSKPNSEDGELPALDDDDHHDKVVMEGEQEPSCNDNNQTSKQVISGPAGVESSSGSEDRSKCDPDGHGQGMKSDLPSRLSDIKKLMEGKRFSRDEINRLIEVINSRAVDLDAEQRKQGLSTTIGEETKYSPRVHESLSKRLEKGRDMSASIWGTSTPFHKPNSGDEVGASPIDIAKAFMEKRTSEGPSCSKSPVDEKGLLCGEDFEGKPVFPSPLPKAAICWPGSMAKEQHGYFTPQVARRSGLPRFPRTPYSRTVYSKSKSKFPELQASSSQWQNLTSSPSQSFQTSTYRQVNLRSDALDDGKDSFGPIRRSRHKAVTERSSRGFSLSHSSNKSPFANLSGFEVTPNVGKNLKAEKVIGTSQSHSVDHRSDTSQVCAPTIPPHSSQIARTILEHLERNPPTPKDKSAELKFAIERKSPSPSGAIVTRNEGKSLLPVRSFNGSNNMDQAVKISGQWNDGRGNSLVKDQCQKNSNEVEAGIKTAPAFGITPESSRHVHDKDSNSQDQSIQKDLSTNMSNAAAPEILNQQAKLLSHFSGTKPVLPSISISKSGPKWALSSNNSSGFSFPVSTSIGVNSEPPTPSIMPSSVNGLHQPEESHAVPEYNFGSNRSQSLAFKFPSTTGASVPESPELKFSFGSDAKNRISFGSIGKNAVCY